MQRKKYITLIIAIVFYTGCAPKALDINYKNRNVVSKQTLGFTSFDLKHDVLLIGDNQFSNIFTDPSIMRNQYAEIPSSVAIRPPQLDIYSEYLFKWVLKQEDAKKKNIIHLGDALNIACENEWKTFSDLLAENKDKFVMAPGNHDFFWFGTTAGYTNNIKLQWGKSCYDKSIYDEKNVSKSEYLSSRMTKGKFINKYLEFILNSDKYKDKNINEEKSFNALIDKIYVKRFKAEEDNYKSFILQRINLSKETEQGSLKGIVIDTANYKNKPLNFYGAISSKRHYGKNRNPGMTAGITVDQMDEIKKWVKNLEINKQYFIVFGHHPLSEFEPKLLDQFKQIFKSQYALGYISAHTHLGYVDDNRTVEIKVNDSTKEKKIIEINVGSITDYPNEIRTLESTKENSKENSKNGLISNSILIPKNPINNQFCAAKYDYTSMYPNYTSYELSSMGLDTAQKAHEMNLNISIMTYIRQFEDLKLFPKEIKELRNKAETLIEKKAQNVCEGVPYSKICKKRIQDKFNFLKKIKKKSDDIQNENLQIYGVCQALWASKAEWIKNNTKCSVIKAISKIRK